MNVPGYDYPAFVRAIAERDGPSCHVHRVLVARRKTMIDQWEDGGLTKADWIPLDLLECHGPMDGHHAGLSKSWLKEHERTVAYQGLVPFDLAAVLNDPRNGIAVCRFHHDLLENARIKLTADELPGCVFEFAAELGDRATGRLCRGYGVRA